MLTRTGIYQAVTPVRMLPAVGLALSKCAPASFAQELSRPDDWIAYAERIVAGELRFFAHQWHRVGSPPDWLHDPWNEQPWPQTLAHWARTNEFSVAGRDIKIVWEPSRFEWAVVLARAYALSARPEFLETFCVWLDDWIAKNPVNAGPNWKCGQEASLRVLRFLEALRCLQWGLAAREPIHAFILAHLRRIGATLSYAIAQENNHGVSEAAALFVGGQWLLAHGAQAETATYAKRMALRGQRQLVERMVRLVAEDGSFSQHSVNYHRMILDTAAIVELWCRALGIDSPLAKCTSRVDAALTWLESLVDEGSGDAPNLGANDGTAMLLSPSTSYRDHRPSLQLVACLFRKCRLYLCGPWDDAARCWGVNPQELPLRSKVRTSRVFRAGGIVALVGRDTWGVLRVPVFRFRPCQADALHLDVWMKGVNVIRDTGTYSYNPVGEWHDYFSGTRAHSTCEFDDRDQMPRHGRFLFLQWLRADTFDFQSDEESQRVVAGYTDYRNARHVRAVRLEGRNWVVSDQLSGYRDKAVVRWHLAPGTWRLHESRLIGPGVCIEVVSTDRACQLRLVEGWESRAYLERTPIPVFEVEVRDPAATIETHIRPA